MLKVSDGIEPSSQDLQSHALPLYEPTNQFQFYCLFINYPTIDANTVTGSARSCKTQKGI